MGHGKIAKTGEIMNKECRVQALRPKIIRVEIEMPGLGVQPKPLGIECPNVWRFTIPESWNEASPISACLALQRSRKENQEE
jgi:hypothetical protein